jgi:membrane associated rhomboid family serine protease
MFPLRDIIPSRTIPVVTVSIIAANTVAWIYELTLPEPVLVEFVHMYGVVPSALDPVAFVTSAFLHGSWFHFIGNMWYLWIFGDNVEDRMGHARFVAFYLLCGVGASVGHVLMEPLSPVPAIGASGAIAGVMGAYFVLYPRSRVLTLVPIIIYFEIVELPAVVLLGVWFLMQLVSAGASAVSPAEGAGIAFAAHVAGFVLGAVGVLILRKERRPRAYWK